MGFGCNMYIIFIHAKIWLTWKLRRLITLKKEQNNTHLVTLLLSYACCSTFSKSSTSAGGILVKMMIELSN